MPPASVIVLGSSNVDLVVRSQRLPRPGETVIGGEFFQALGGKGANQAVAAARSALAPVTFITSIGDDDYGRTVRAAFDAENLDRRYIKTVEGSATGVALILVSAGGENLISVASGANVRLEASDVEGVDDDTFRSARVLLASLEVPLDTVVAGLKRARRHGLTTILNPAPASPRIASHEILELVDVITPNESEIELLTGIAPRDEASIERAAASLRDLGCTNVVLTCGAAGAWMLSPEGRQHIPARSVQAVDTTAAGDAFSGVLAVALAEGLPLADACHRASLAAAISVTRAGAQPSLPRRDEIL